MLFADMAYSDGEEIPVGALIAPKIEGEVSFVMGDDLEMEHPTIADVTNAIAYATASIEIVDSRVRDWDISILDTVADNASAGAFILGNEPHALEDFDPAFAAWSSNTAASRFRSAPVLPVPGNPLNAMVWLAREMVARGRPLSAGDIVMSGALGPMVPVTPGEVYEVRINGLGSARAVFGEEK